jgi:hypothetical protein
MFKILIFEQIEGNDKEDVCCQETVSKRVAQNSPSNVSAFSNRSVRSKGKAEGVRNAAYHNGEAATAKADAQTHTKPAKPLTPCCSMWY